MSIVDDQAQQAKLLDYLVKEGLINADASKKIEFDAANNHLGVADIIFQSDYVDEKNKVKIRAIIDKIPFVDLINVDLPSDLINKVPQEIARKYQAVLFAENEAANEFSVGMVDPTNMELIKMLSTLFKKNIKPYYAWSADLKQVIDTRYGAQVGADVVQAMRDVGDSFDEALSADSMISELQGDISAAPVAKIVNTIMSFAVKVKASDVHIEPREARLGVRYRVNGVLSEKLSLPVKLMPAIISRIKILSDLKIDEHRVPQDGRFQIKVDEEMIDLRVSVIPTVYGEKIVIRLLEKGGGTMTLDKTGLIGRNLDEFQKSIKKTQGIILVTGPTGSGKTVTLASCLKILNKESVNIVTLEDPVEIRVDGVNQVQVNSEVGLTFAKGLRAFLRQDPNIIMLGEIRDSETASLAVQAALTGHLVLATLHTNDAATAVPRLLDMNIEPFLIASTLNLVAAQRLARTVCKHCKEQYEASEDELNKIKSVLGEIHGFDFQKLMQSNNDKLFLYRGKGCAQCNGTGYSGRIGIFEVMISSPELSELIIKKESAQKIENLAREQGMTRMITDGFIKSLQGITTIEEVLRVVN